MHVSRVVELLVSSSRSMIAYAHDLVGCPNPWIDAIRKQVLPLLNMCIMRLSSMSQWRRTVRPPTCILDSAAFVASRAIIKLPNRIGTRLGETIWRSQESTMAWAVKSHTSSADASIHDQETFTINFQRDRFHHLGPATPLNHGISVDANKQGRMATIVKGNHVAAFHKSTLCRQRSNRLMSEEPCSAAVMPSSVLQGRRQSFPASQNFVAFSSCSTCAGQAKIHQMPSLPTRRFDHCSY
jgi:hypothetical protein